MMIALGASLNAMNGQVRNDSISENDSLATKELDEVVISAVKKYTKPTARGLKVSMEGNPLSEIGSAIDAIKQMPMIDGSGEGITVTGKGAPVIYINGRLMRNSQELEMLTSADLQSVEIITNPSAKYGTEVSSVILIRTKRRIEGVYANIGGTVTASEAWSESASGGAGYKMENGLTLFGDFSLSDSRFKQKRWNYDSFPADLALSGAAEGAERMHSETDTRSRNHTFSFMTDGGLNYDFKGHSLGVKYTFNRTPFMNYNSEMETMSNALDENKLNTANSIDSQDSRHYINSYAYFTLPRSIDLRFDFDYVGNMKRYNNNANEHQAETDIDNRGTTDIKLYSGKIELEKKWQKISLLAGGDYTYTSSDQEFRSINSADAAADAHATDDVRQNLYSAFITADWKINERWSLSGGLRYDATRTRYTCNGIFEPGLSKNYGNLLPDISVSFQSPVVISLFYRQTVYRPSYSSLDNNYTFVTPTHWDRGNPQLQPMRADVIGLSLYYKKFIFQGYATHYIRKIGLSCYYEPALNASVATTVNLPAYTQFQFVAVQNLDFGFWHPTLQGVILLQDLKFGEPSRKYNKPFFQMSVNNRFDLPKKFYAYLSAFARGTGDVETQFMYSWWQMSLTLSKNHKNWTFSLVANDIFGTWRQKYLTKTNYVDFIDMRKGASQMVYLSVRYQFNQAKSKYRGKSVRSDEIDRM